MSDKALEYKGLPLVAYTDGGARGQAQYAGAGLHGYFYDPDKVAEKSLPTEQAKRDQPTTHGYTDDNNYQYMANDQCAKVVTPKVVIDGVEVLGAGVSNNVAELKAAIWALQVAKSAESPQLLVLADSEYVVKGVNEYSQRWKEAGWVKPTGQPLANAELWKALDDEIVTYRQADYKPSLTFQWTQAHVGNYGNERADTLATRGVFKSKEGDSVANDALDHPKRTMNYSPVAGYYNPKVNHNRLLAGQHFYFFSNAHESRKSSDGRSIYYMGSQGGDGTLHGKPVSDATYIVSYLKERDPIVDHLIEKVEKQDLGGHGRTYRGELASLLNARLYNELTVMGWSDFVYRHEKSNDFYLDNTLLVSERNPPFLAWRDEESLSLVRTILESFLARRQKDDMEAREVQIPGLVHYNRLGHREVKPNGFDVVVTELSEYFFVAEDGKKKNTHKLTDFLEQATKSVVVPLNFNTTGELQSAKVPLTVGLDIARRNVLGAVLAQNPRIFGVTWRASDVGFYYATVLQTDDDVAIWCTVHSNLRAVVKADHAVDPKEVAGKVMTLDRATPTALGDVESKAPEKLSKSQRRRRRQAEKKAAAKAAAESTT